MTAPFTHKVSYDEIGAPKKLVAHDELADKMNGVRALCKRIVHCHGVFDLLHIGHIRHLQEAKRLGDVLIVSITTDSLVNKGAHRPAFVESLRAEALSALGVVDYVTISPFHSAVEVIELIKPNLYVKGPDYRDGTGDITGGIAREIKAVESFGGRVYFTDDETFSSSHLLNRHVQTLSKVVEDYLIDFRSRYTPSDVIAVIERLAALKVTIIGETIIDEYIDCDQMGKSAKDPVLAMRYHAHEQFAGGAVAVANHIASFVDSVNLLTYLGSERSQEAFIRSHLKENVKLCPVYKSQSPTIVKQRFIETTLRSKLFEVYYINDDLLSQDEEALLCSMIDEAVASTDLILSADFGHGLLSPLAISRISNADAFLAINTQINAANIRYHAISAYFRSDYICINEAELRLDARNRHADLNQLIFNLSSRLNCPRILVTRGSSGAVYFNGTELISAPALTHNVVDRIGSGDAVLAVTSAAVSADAEPPIVTFLANVIGAQAVQIIGNKSSIDRIATIKFIESLLK
jgi:rfaE bifunctional protein nucleotidyltransferase chain/domain